jgi:hypothetical protein
LVVPVGHHIWVEEPETYMGRAKLAGNMAVAVVEAAQPEWAEQELLAL